MFYNYSQINPESSKSSIDLHLSRRAFFLKKDVLNIIELVIRL